MIRHTSFKHGWFYHYRVHEEKLARLSKPFPALQQYLLGVFDDCPDEYFQSGPRGSKLQMPIKIEPVHVKNHGLCAMTAFALENGRFKTAHSNVQVAMLENDHTTVAVEVPLWLLPDDLDGFSDVFGEDRPLTGHIDALSVDDDRIWIWDYKPGASKERYAHVQTYMYAVMLSTRTGIPLENFRCGYFDKEDCYVFLPERPERVLPIIAG